jgi:hypothetical protein
MHAHMFCAGLQTLRTMAQDHLDAESTPRLPIAQDLEVNEADTSSSVQMYSNMEQSSSVVDHDTVVMPAVEE